MLDLVECSQNASVFNLSTFELNSEFLVSLFWFKEKAPPPWSVRGKSFTSLNNIEGMLDRFEFFERLQVLIDRNEKF